MLSCFVYMRAPWSGVPHRSRTFDDGTHCEAEEDLSGPCCLVTELKDGSLAAGGRVVVVVGMVVEQV